MKKQLLGIACIAFFAGSVFAQTPITLNQSSYTSTFANTNDTVLTSILSSTYPNLSAATNASWDMTGAVSTTSVGSIRHVSPYTSVFASAQYADSLLFPFNGVPSATYLSDVQNTITSAGFSEYGQHVKRQSFNPPGFGATDSVVVDAQDIVYDNPRTIIQFPATYLSTWTSTYSYHFNFHLSIAALLLSNAAGYISSHITEKDSVVGWGQMEVKQLDGSTSGFVNVLQVKTTVSDEDSFYMPGTSAFVLSTLMSQINVSQGQVSNSYYQYYYRPNEVTPLAKIVFSDSTYSAPSSAQTHAQRLPPGPGGVTSLSANNRISVYPNPVTGGNISIDIPQISQNNNWTYELIDINGKHILSNALRSAHTQIRLSSDMSVGIYYLSLKNNGRPIETRAIDVVK